MRCNACRRRRRGPSPRRAFGHGVEVAAVTSVNIIGMGGYLYATVMRRGRLKLAVVGGAARPIPQGLAGLAPVAQLRRLVVVFAGLAGLALCEDTASSLSKF